MSEKTGVAGISGNRHPRIGEKTFFEITEWYPATPAHLRNTKNITWELFKRREDGRYTTTGIKKKGTNFFIFGQISLGHQYRVEGYLNQPEGRTPMAMEVVPVDTDTPRFIGVEVYDAAGNRVQGPLQYGMKVKVVVLSAGMIGKNVKISLWEDRGLAWPKLPHYAAGHSATINKNGVAKAEFDLWPDMRQLTSPPDQLHDFYITAEYWSSKDKNVYLSSDHKRLVNPDFKKYDLFERPKPVKTTEPLKTQRQVKDNLPAPALKAMDWFEIPLQITGKAFREWTVAKGKQKYVVGGMENGEENNTANGEFNCYCKKMGIVSSVCSKDLVVIGIPDEVYEYYANKIGCEKEVIKAIAKQESQGEPFVSNNTHAKILYERHYAYRLLKAKGKTQKELKDFEMVKDPKGLPIIYPQGYSIKGKEYGSYLQQIEKLDIVKEIDKDVAIQSCSWGRFQVMGVNFKGLYKNPSELEDAQNHCEIQHLALFFQEVSTNTSLIAAMKMKDWEKIAYYYNGPKWRENDYANKIKKYYEGFNK
ncbi:MAG: DUF3380 domain-containing protein [Niabella sp.]|nr:DUF3380 domain-containing protein [Niabella sp.]